LVLEEDDPNRLRDVEIKRLVELAQVAYENAREPDMSMKMREAWHRRYTNTVEVLNRLLKDSQIKDYTRKLQAILDNEDEEQPP
jgi:hypothetical protein